MRRDKSQFFRLSEKTFWLRGEQRKKWHLIYYSLIETYCDQFGGTFLYELKRNWIQIGRYEHYHSKIKQPIPLPDIAIITHINWVIRLWSFSRIQEISLLFLIMFVHEKPAKQERERDWRKKRCEYFIVFYPPSCALLGQAGSEAIRVFFALHGYYALHVLFIHFKVF